MKIYSNSLSCFTLAFMCLMISSCATQNKYHGIEATDLSGLFYGMSRADVENITGSPIEENQCRKGSIVTYHYDRGYKGCIRHKACSSSNELNTTLRDEVVNTNIDYLGIPSFMDNYCLAICQTGSLQIFYDLNANLRGVKEINSNIDKDSFCWKHFSPNSTNRRMKVSCSRIYRERRPPTLPKILILEIEAEEYCDPHMD